MKNIDDYQEQAVAKAIYPGRGAFMGMLYCALKLNGEAGEIAEKIGKAWRDDNGWITPERKQAVLLEMGDVLWYIANLASELDFTMSEVAAANITKLVDRRVRGVQRGSGDNR